jgi:hypothetical protein
LAGLRHLKFLELFSNDNLAGTLPSEMANMESLESLKVQYSSTGGQLPSEMGRLTNLRELLVDGTLLTGDMPPEICHLRQENLSSLQANCRGEHPLIRCSCCTACK